MGNPRDPSATPQDDVENMSKFIINGGNKLNGAWRVQGMKNAATPILAATLLTRERCTIHNIPRISDLNHMLAILKDLGAEVSWLSEHTLQIQTKKIIKNEMDYLLTKRMRSSVLCLGPLLAATGYVRMPEPGGCNIGNRPLNTHIFALQALGAEVECEAQYYNISGAKLQGKEISLPEKSVTATENLLMAASITPGTTIIKNAAAEPHVACLVRFLRQMGADISGAGTHEIKVKGVSELQGAEFSVIPDQLEVGTIAILAALSGGEITISPVVSKDMAVIAAKLKEAGVDFIEQGESWLVRGSPGGLRPFQIETAPYPGFPTDLQAPFGVLATQAQGESLIRDPLYENRLGYMEELKKMGARAIVVDPHAARVIGPTPLTGQTIHSLDLRAGATLIIAALIAQGQSVIEEAEIIDRGYEAIDARLRALGADIRRVE